MLRYKSDPGPVPVSMFRYKRNPGSAGNQAGGRAAPTAEHFQAVGSIQFGRRPVYLAEGRLTGHKRAIPTDIAVESRFITLFHDPRRSVPSAHARKRDPRSISLERTDRHELTPISSFT